jgi:uncharacterized protein
MNWVILIAIQLYWLFRPKFLKRQCLFKETCSHHVYRIAQERGLAAGIIALRKRSRICRPGYQIVSSGIALQVQLVDGSKISESEASVHLFAPIHDIRRNLIESLQKGQSSSARTGETDRSP